MSRTMPSVVNLPLALEGATLRMEIERGFRAPIRNGSVVMEGMWRADLYKVLPGEWRAGRRHTPKPLFLGTFCTDSTKEETPADLLRQLADIYEAGELKVGAA